MKNEECPATCHRSPDLWSHEWITATAYRCDPGGEIVLTVIRYVETPGGISTRHTSEVRSGPFTADLEVEHWLNEAREQVTKLL